ncbi:MAG: glutamate synthase large subunit, partial [Acidimicrobiia bacterium]|nr:glutamate synthase large subunit [Acidimicrobiia bacterium]
VRGGARIIVISDREVDAEHAAIPMPLAVSAVHHRLIEEGTRLGASLVCVSGETRTDHDVAVLLGLGASAVNPYLAIEEARRAAAEGRVAADPVVAQENYRMALRNGLLKIMSKMGICTVSAYRGSELFEVIGLDDDVCSLAFRFAVRRVGGVGFDELGRQAIAMHAEFGDEGSESLGGFYKFRRGGEVHVTSPSVVLSVQKAVRSGDQTDWNTYREAIEDRPPSQLRDLLRFVERRAIDIDDVEPAERIMRRFVTAAMSLGALSREAHEALAEAMAMVGGLSNSGEGGEDPARFQTPRNSSIKQVASGRFGVTPGYLASAEEFQIKMAQGSKPGEGGQLPGHKVTPEIAWLRHTEPGVSLISPPPHHDIYSIEDLAQLIYDLKAFKRTARVSVKLVSEPGVGTVAVGVAKAQADAITISGNDGGTGASPLTSIKHAGSPWELGIAEAHQVLIANGLRSRVALETDGGIRTGRDVVIAALLGAERFGFGTLPLLALGCKMVRQCHLNTCPVGIATQREDLRAKFSGAPDQVVQLFRLLAEEVREHLASLGVRSLEEVIGRADLLEPADPGHPIAASLAPLLVRAEGRRRHPGYIPTERPQLSERLVEAVAAGLDDALAGGNRIDVAYPITNEDRTIGATISGFVADRFGDEGIPDGTVSVRLAGIAGQSFGAFLSKGIDMRLDGTANDYVGKGMGGGSIVVVPRRREGQAVPHAAGNAVLYGATGGALFLAGTAGQRFAVRNSGATAVVEGISDHGCEYMTGGTVVVLGPVGRNFAAGMTGGTAFVWDVDAVLNAKVSDSAPGMQRPSPSDKAAIRTLVEQHQATTGSEVARDLLEAWDRQSGRFWVLRAGAAKARASEKVVTSASAGE